MRLIHGGFAVIVACGLTSMAAGGGSYWGDHAGCAACGGYGGYAACACGAPEYGLAPGCCESPPSCCYHVWDGYCQERARWLSRRGAWCFGGAGYCGPNGNAYAWGTGPWGGVEIDPSASPDAAAPTPAAPQQAPQDVPPPPSPSK